MTADMPLSRFTTASLLAAACLVPASAVVAQDLEVTISGATLFEPYFLSPANTSDFIDADNDGLITNFAALTFDNLVGPTGSNGNQFQQQYRAIGSGNGFQELVDFGSVNGPGASFTALNDANGGAPNVVNGADVGGSVATFRGPAVVDISTTDVPAGWAVQNPGTGIWNASPTTGGVPTAGYGTNAQLSNPVFKTNAIPEQAGGFNNDLQTLAPSAASPGTTALTFDGSNQGPTRIYQTPIALSPIAFIANAGAAESTAADAGNVTKSELAHLFVSGRMANGENLIAITRDSGSGTRNGAMNSIGVDPSWGAGDNVGSLNRGSSTRSSASNLDSPGPDYIPNQKQSSSRMELAVEMTRLGVGYQGIVGNAGTDSTQNEYEILNVANDLDTTTDDGSPAWDGTSFVRPIMTRNGETFAENNVVFNADPNTGWQIGAIQTLSTIGNPFAGTIIVDADGVARFDDAANAQTGEKVFAEYDTSAADTVNSPVVGGLEAGDAPMADPYAALYIRNLERSIQAFSALPADPDNQGTPGEALASSFALAPAADSVTNGDNPAVFVNGPTNPLLQGASVLPEQIIEPSYGGDYGKVPFRDNTGTYSDGLTANYVANDGTAIAYGIDLLASTAIGDANAIAGDFDGDLDRDVDDVDDMVQAWVASNAGDRTVLTGNKAKQSLEIIGDFNNDGSFDIEDVRYGADGLFAQGSASGFVDRKANFTAVDAEFGGNFFGTGFDAANTLSTYDDGDSRADIAGSDFEAAGWAPNGADGVIDLTDVDYVYAQFVGLDQDGTDGVEWANLDEVAGKVLVDGERVDFSADMTGDGVINLADIQEVVVEVLDTVYGDVDLSGNIEQADLNAVLNNWGALDAGYSGGDYDASGQVEQGDLNIILNNWGGTAAPSFAGFESIVPEPSVAMLGLGLAGLAMRRRRTA